MKTASRPADRYTRCEDFAARIDGIELAPEVWAVFAQLSQHRDAAELARRLKLDVEAVNASLRRLVRRKLVRKLAVARNVVAWRDYAATAAIADEPAPAVPAPNAQLSALNSQRPSVHSAPPFYVQQSSPSPSSQLSTLSPQLPSPPSAPRSPILSLRIGPSQPPARPAPAVSLRIDTASPARTPAPASDSLHLKLPPSSGGATATDAPGLRLRPVLDAIGAKAGGGIAGQLLVYRVFLQIPTELMHAAGIHSLSLVDDHFTLTHPELRAALADTARRHAGVDIETLAAAV